MYYISVREIMMTIKKRGKKKVTADTQTIQKKTTAEDVQPKEEVSRIYYLLMLMNPLRCSFILKGHSKHS